MALSGLQENVTLTKPYLPQMASIYVRHWYQMGGENGTSGDGRTILTNVKSLCVPPCVSWGMTPLWDSRERLPKMEGRGAL